MSIGGIVEGLVRYPDDLPCPQVDTDLKPRERRYISDVSEVKRYRPFQRGFQGTRNNVSFVFTPQEHVKFQEWYKEIMIEGGGWFYADWPLLHKEKDVAHRFVTRPVWNFLARGYIHVTATVEVYERKVGKVGNIYTSKIYPLYFADRMTGRYTVKGMPFAGIADDFAATDYTVIYGRIKGGLKNLTIPTDDFASTCYTVVSGNMRQYTYGSMDIPPDDLAATDYTVVSGELKSSLIGYDYFTDDLSSSLYTVVSGDLS